MPIMAARVDSSSPGPQSATRCCQDTRSIATWKSTEMRRSVGGGRQPTPSPFSPSLGQRKRGGNVKRYASLTTSVLAFHCARFH
ncbi:hypothetical protein O3P69_010554 [Scylla paramamosain]|uniref:Uncharacterized protein n=1 Tax=Scylla paramamosain TaxID=85552 RepID=A0AAW0TEX9_SCYPA